MHRHRASTAGGVQETAATPAALPPTPPTGANRDAPLPVKLFEVSDVILLSGDKVRPSTRVCACGAALPALPVVRWPCRCTPRLAPGPALCRRGACSLARPACRHRRPRPFPRWPRRAAARPTGGAWWRCTVTGRPALKSSTACSTGSWRCCRCPTQASAAIAAPVSISRCACALPGCRLNSLLVCRLYAVGLHPPGG